MKSLKKGKSPGIDNIPGELVQAGGDAVIRAFHKICNKIWQTGEWPIPWTQYLIITLPKKGKLQQCKNYRTISLICHPSKVLLKVLLNRLKPQAESVIAEEQAGFRSGQSTLTNSFQHLSGENYDRRTRRSLRNSQNRRQNNYQLTFC